MRGQDRDPIAAIATPRGRAALLLVRLSSPDNPERFLEALCPDASIPWPSRHPRHVNIVDEQGSILDDALVTWFAAPRSATGEHLIEFSLHGNPVLGAALLDRLVGLGARRAEGGEFSRRALLNGRMSLAEAEAVGSIIDSASLIGAQMAHRAFGGALDELLRSIQKDLANALAQIEASVDFPEQVEDADIRAVQMLLQAVWSACAELSERGRRQQLWREGLRVVIAGPPNAGKSSLFNHLLGRERAIVSDEPGTTRDLIEASLGIDITLVDTAGLRDTHSAIEKEGVHRSMHEFAHADLIVWVRDGRDLGLEKAPSAGPVDPRAVIVQKLGVVDPQFLYVATRLDQMDDALVRALCEDEHKWMVVDAKGGAGVERVRDSVESRAKIRGADQEIGAVSARQCDLLERISTLSRRVHDVLEEGEWGLGVSYGRDALDAFGALMGREMRDEVLDAAFANFCIGK